MPTIEVEALTSLLLLIAGKTSTILSTVLEAEEVCNVPKTRCPVSAAVIAKLIVSKSLISPIYITSGSSLKAALNAVEKFFVSLLTSRW